MKGTLALVTGVGRREGIGAHICTLLAEQGADIFFTLFPSYDKDTYPQLPPLNPEEFARELRSFGVEAHYLLLDLREEDAPARLFEEVKATLGTPDILINNAAVSINSPFEKITPELLDVHYKVNVRATTLLCKEFALQNKPGKIVNLTSGQAISVMKNELPYTITKAGVDMLTQQLAPELKEKNISIVAYDPGPTDTGWIDDSTRETILKQSVKGKIKTPKESAEELLAILSDQKTGEVVHASW